MINVLEVRCTFCPKIFCCKNCREKHEILMHLKEINKAKRIIPNIRDKCPACNDHQFQFSKNLMANEDLLHHIKEKHLPLQCKKCSMMYTKIDDLKNFTNCKKIETCNHERITIKEEGSVALNSISTQTSPAVVDKSVPVVLEANLEKVTNTSPNCVTPYTNSSSLKNVALTDSSKNLTPYELIALCSGKIDGNVPEKIVRTTSTPVQNDLCGSQGEASSGLESCQVSSIHASSALSINSSSTIQTRNNSQPSKLIQSFAKGNQIIQSRRKNVIMTPLRRVMSKSIQRAIAECRVIDSNSSSPLDLRTTPVVRRSQDNPNIERNLYKQNLLTIPILKTPESSDSDECSKVQQKFVFSGKKVTMTTETTKTTTTKSILIASVSCSNQKENNKENDIIYGTNHSVKFVNEEIHQAFLHKLSDQENLLNNKCRDWNNFQLTPKFPFVPPLKKVISFDTPSEIRRSSLMEEITSDKEDEESEIFSTPLSTPMTSFSDIHESDDRNTITENDVSNRKEATKDLNNENNEENIERKGFWSVIRAVMKLPLLWKNVHEEDGHHEEQNYLEYKRDINFSLENDSDENIRQKRKRVHFTENPLKKDDLTEEVHHCNCSNCEIPPKRIKHIQGRRPIRRTNLSIVSLKKKLD